MRCTQNKQQGIALLTVLLVVVLATIAAIGMTSRQQIDIRRTENILRNEQMYLYLLGAEDWAKQILAKDSKDNQIDTFTDDWATQLPPIPIDGGVISGALEDMQGRFNLNSLFIDGDLDKENFARFKRLLQVLELPPQLAETLVDWLDANEQARPQGAEDNYYLNNEFPYRTANGEMASSSELLYISGFDFESVQRLKPYIAALPGNTAININTSSAEVIACLAEGITLESAKQLVDERGTEGYASIEEFIKHRLFTGKELKKENLTVVSAHFILSAQVTMGQSQSQLKSLMKRVNTNIVVMQRAQGDI